VDGERREITEKGAILTRGKTENEKHMDTNTSNKGVNEKALSDR